MGLMHLKWFEEKGHLEVKNNKLFIGGLEAEEIAREFGTPLYVYNGNRIIENFKTIEAAFKCSDRSVNICFAMKANPHIAILKLLLKEGACIDATSSNEVKIALRAGFPREKIMFTGTSVSNTDLKELMDAGVLINVDSVSQLRRLKKQGFNGMVSIRWNPGLSDELHVHRHVITAGKYVKFGIPESNILNAFKEAKEAGLEVVGLHQHIGSGWLGKDVETFLETVDRTIGIAEKAENVLGKSLDFIDFGGGPGIPYSEGEEKFPIEEYAKGICEKLQKSGLKAKIKVEPGRFIVGDAGILLVEVNTVEGKNVETVGVNAGFNTLLRPAFYQAFHEIVLCNGVNNSLFKDTMVAGNLCESGDVFNESKEDLRKLPKIKEGDILAILCAGAYGYAMSSNYNSQSRPREVMILNGKPHLITEKDSIEDLLHLQREID